MSNSQFSKQPIETPPSYTPPTNVYTVQPQYYQRTNNQYEAAPPNYLAWSIINFCFCWILAIPAVIYSREINYLNIVGNYQAARVKSKNVLILNIFATVIGLVWIVVVVTLYATGNFYVPYYEINVNGN